jgi:hypothetical protein
VPRPAAVVDEPVGEAEAPSYVIPLELVESSNRTIDVGIGIRDERKVRDPCHQGQGDHDPPGASEGGTAGPLHGRRTTPVRP